MDDGRRIFKAKRLWSINHNPIRCEVDLHNQEREGMIMSRSVLTSLLLLLCVSSAMAEEFVVKIEHQRKDAIGEENIDQAKFKTMTVVEVDAELNKKFYFQLKTWPRTVTYKGQIRPDEKGRYEVNGSLKIEQESRNMIPVTKTRKEPVIDLLGSSTTITINLDTPVMIGQFSIITDATVRKPRHAQVDEYLMTLSRKKTGNKDDYNKGATQ